MPNRDSVLNAVDANQQLRERKKELRAVYSISQHLLLNHKPVASALEQIVQELPPAMKFPERASAEISYRDIRVATEGFDSAYRNIKADLTVDNETAGHIAIAYDRHIPVEEDSFLPEEQAMIENIGETLSIWLGNQNLAQELDKPKSNVEQFESIINNGPAIAFAWELHEGWPVVYVSNNVKNLGYDPEDFLSGKLIFDQIIHPDDLARVSRQVEYNLTADSTKFEQRYRILTKDGNIRWVRDWTLINRTEDGTAINVEGILIDITDYVSAEEAARQYLNLTNNIFLVLDSEGIVTDFNDMACILTESSAEELTGVPFIEIFTAEDQRAKIKDSFSKIVQSAPEGEQEYENDIVSKSGKRHTIHWYSSVEKNESGDFKKLIVFGADRTSQLLAESRVTQYSQFPKENPNPVLRIDDQGDVILANGPAQELLDSIATHSGSASLAWARLVQDILKSRSKINLELKTEDSYYLFSVVRIAESGYYNLYGLDITDNKLLNNRLQSVSANLPGALFDYSLRPDGSDAFEYANPGCESIWEITVQDMLADASHLWDMIHPDDVQFMKKSIQDSARTLEDWKCEWRILPASGKTKWLRGSGSPRKLDDGGVRWTSIVLDITEAKEAEQAVAEALRRTVYVLASALEARDPYTAGHEQRVTEIARQIGQEMQLDDHRLQGLEMAAMVHDVGKIKVPLEILSKSGRLSDREFELIKIHPDVGADLLKDISFDWPISTIIRQHHERLDGSGYPQGLRGDDIILESRILAVADVLEAMASHRPYRPGLGIDVAAEEIRRGAGILYDTTAAEACLKLVKEGKIQL